MKELPACLKFLTVTAPKSKFNNGRFIGQIFSTMYSHYLLPRYFYNMKIYQFKQQEIFLNDGVTNEERYLEVYKNLLLNLLISRNISQKKIFQALNLNSYTVSSKPFIVEPLLKKKTLPPFVFLTCKN